MMASPRFLSASNPLAFTTQDLQQSHHDTLITAMACVPFLGYNRHEKQEKANTKFDTRTQFRKVRRFMINGFLHKARQRTIANVSTEQVKQTASKSKWTLKAFAA
jgi:hypothetical protein